jgi:lipopolysaccharide transport system permease protein
LASAMQQGINRSSAMSRYTELLFYKAYADLRSESERTYVGFLWWFIEPVISMLVFYFIFSYVLRRGTEDYVAFLLTGMVAWKWFNSTLVSGARSIPINAALMQQVYVPKAIFPLVLVVSNTAKFSIAFLLLVVFLFAYGFEPNVQYAALPAVLGVQLLFIIGATWIVAGIMPFFPDIQILMDNVLRVAFFLSGIFFPISQIPESVRDYFYLNPMVTIIESHRAILMHGRWPDWSGLGAIALFSLLACVVGWAITRRYDRVYVKSLM